MKHLILTIMIFLTIKTYGQNAGNFEYIVAGDSVSIFSTETPMFDDSTHYDSIKYGYVFTNAQDYTQHWYHHGNDSVTLKIPFCSSYMIRTTIGYLWGNQIVIPSEKIFLNKEWNIYIKTSTYAKSKFLHKIEGEFDEIEMIVSDHYNYNKEFNVFNSTMSYGSIYDQYQISQSEFQKFFVPYVGSNNPHHYVIYKVTKEGCKQIIGRVIYL